MQIILKSLQKENNNTLIDIDSISKIPVVANILEIVCNTTGMGFSAVARVTTDKWIACAVNDQINFGLVPGGELKLESTICNEIRQHHNPVVIDHVAEDENFASHHTPLQYGFQSYISVPIICKDGSFFGTLCAIDPKPAKLNNPTILGMFKMFADLIAFHLDALEELAISEERLQLEKETSELREQFIAILGHDLRNPLNAISNSAQLLARINQDERTQKLVNVIKDSSFRMNGLIENMLDFASGRLGGGITISPTPDEDLEKVLFQVVEEIHAISPDKKMKLDFDVEHPVLADGKRIAQLFSNLLGNALSYSPQDSTIEITAVTNAEEFTLCVANPGKKIPDATLERLFQPFSRGGVESNQKGLGLGLFISSEIAKAHGGKLEVSSDEERTCFKLTLPSLK